MKQLKIYQTTIAFLFITIFTGIAQNNKCATMKLYEKRKLNDVYFESRINQLESFTSNWISQNQNLSVEKGNSKKAFATTITIPVVVHVIYHTATENVSSAQIQSQIDALNEDFRLLNADSLQPNHPFWPYTADTQIEFCLAKRDPNGNPTTGITRTYTDSLSFSANGYEKFTATGGKDNWAPTKYLNIWVCNLDNSGGTLGYAAFPSDLASFPAEDGVIIRYEAFGTIGTAGTGGFSENDLGRTGTHEVGHWLNLRHIWGDATCGSDFVNDTEPAEDANYFCPSFPNNANNSCGAGSNGEMYMNYMDYVDDGCMNMFTFGQSNRMHAAINGPRAGLLTSQGCTAPAGINEITFSNQFMVYPNPSNKNITISRQDYFNSDDDIVISLIDPIGRTVYSTSSNLKNNLSIAVSAFESGCYSLKFESKKNVGFQKVIILK
jgi:hypothetical protein